MEAINPTTPLEALEAVVFAAEEKQTLEVRSAGTKCNQGGLVKADTLLDVSGLVGIIDYVPTELVFSASELRLSKNGITEFLNGTVTLIPFISDFLMLSISFGISLSSRSFFS